MNGLVFDDRSQAGRLLAEALKQRRIERPAVYALPRGGVPVAFEVAKALGAPLDLVLVRKIGAPDQPELAVGAVVDGPAAETVLNEDIVRLLAIEDDYIAAQTRLRLEEIAERRRNYLGGRPRVDAAGRTAILVDDGIATGATMRAAVHAIARAHPLRIIVAVPVAPPETVERFRDEPAEIVSLSTPDAFFAIGQFYRDFHQVPDDEVRAILAQAAAAAPSGPAEGDERA